MTEKYPVMLWIHGGSFIQGGSSFFLYDYTNFVNEKQDVIVVTFNYRLGLLGWLYDNTFSTGVEGNFGYQDQKLVIEWVRSNIKFFGGDKTKITLIGHSAGAESVGMHLLYNNDNGKIAGGIMQSPSFQVPSRDPTTWNDVPERFSELVGCPTETDEQQASLLDCWRFVDVDTILSIQQDSAFSNGWPWAPVLFTPTTHTELIPNEPLFAFQDAPADSFKNVPPFIIGTQPLDMLSPNSRLAHHEANNHQQTKGMAKPSKINHSQKSSTFTQSSYQSQTTNTTDDAVMQEALHRDHIHHERQQWQYEQPERSAHDYVNDLAPLIEAFKSNPHGDDANRDRAVPASEQLTLSARGSLDTEDTMETGQQTQTTSNATPITSITRLTSQNTFDINNNTPMTRNTVNTVNTMNTLHIVSSQSAHSTVHSTQNNENVHHNKLLNANNNSSNSNSNRRTGRAELELKNADSENTQNSNDEDENDSEHSSDDDVLNEDLHRALGSPNTETNTQTTITTTKKTKTRQRSKSPRKKLHEEDDDDDMLNIAKPKLDNDPMHTNTISTIGTATTPVKNRMNALLTLHEYQPSITNAFDPKGYDHVVNAPAELRSYLGGIPGVVEPGVIVVQQSAEIELESKQDESDRTNSDDDVVRSPDYNQHDEPQIVRHISRQTKLNKATLNAPSAHNVTAEHDPFDTDESEIESNMANYDELNKMNQQSAYDQLAYNIANSTIKSQTSHSHSHHSTNSKHSKNNNNNNTADTHLRNSGNNNNNNNGNANKQAMFDHHDHSHSLRHRGAYISGSEDTGSNDSENNSENEQAKLLSSNHGKPSSSKHSRVVKPVPHGRLQSKYAKPHRNNNNNVHTGYALQLSPPQKPNLQFNSMNMNLNRQLSDNTTIGSMPGHNSKAKNMSTTTIGTSTIHRKQSDSFAFSEYLARGGGAGNDYQPQHGTPQSQASTLFPPNHHHHHHKQPLSPSASMTHTEMSLDHADDHEFRAVGDGSGLKRFSQSYAIPPVKVQKPDNNVFDHEHEHDNEREQHIYPSPRDVSRVEVIPEEDGEDMSSSIQSNVNKRRNEQSNNSRNSKNRNKQKQQHKSSKDEHMDKLEANNLSIRMKSFESIEKMQSIDSLADIGNLLKKPSVDTSTSLGNQSTDYIIPIMTPPATSPPPMNVGHSPKDDNNNNNGNGNSKDSANNQHASRAERVSSLALPNIIHLSNNNSNKNNRSLSQYSAQQQLKNDDSFLVSNKTNSLHKLEDLDDTPRTSFVLAVDSPQSRAQNRENSMVVEYDERSTFKDDIYTPHSKSRSALIKNRSLTVSAGYHHHYSHSNQNSINNLQYDEHDLSGKHKQPRNRRTSKNEKNNNHKKHKHDGVQLADRATNSEEMVLMEEKSMHQQIMDEEDMDGDLEHNMVRERVLSKSKSKETNHVKRSSMYSPHQYAHRSTDMGMEEMAYLDSVVVAHGRHDREDTGSREMVVHSHRKSDAFDHYYHNNKWTKWIILLALSLCFILGVFMGFGVSWIFFVNHD